MVPGLELGVAPMPGPKGTPGETSGGSWYRSEPVFGLTSPVSAQDSGDSHCPVVSV